MKLLNPFMANYGTTPTFVNSGTNITASAVTTLSVTYSPVAGNFIVFTAGFTTSTISAVTCKDNNGNSLTLNGSLVAYGSLNLMQFYGVAVAGATSYTLSWTTASQMTLVLTEYSGVSGVGATNQTNFSTANKNWTITVATTQPNSYVAVCAAGEGTVNAETVSWSTGTLRRSSSNADNWLMTQGDNTRSTVGSLTTNGAFTSGGTFFGWGVIALELLGVPTQVASNANAIIAG